MTRCVLVLVLVLATAAIRLLAADPDPKKLEVQAEKTKAAAELVAKLDDKDVTVRDKATRQLKEMGRDALPAMEAVLKGKPADQVLNHLAVLLPAARQDDLGLRAAAFLADKERKFDHALPGWDDLKAAVGDTKESRLLMADILADEECREMLVLARDLHPDGKAKFQKRWRAKADELRAAVTPPGLTTDDPAHWLFAALLADLLHPADYYGDSLWHVTHTYLSVTDVGTQAVAGKGRYGEVAAKFVRHWIDRQTRPLGLGAARDLAREMKFGKEYLTAVLERQFAAAVEGQQQGPAFAQLAATRDPKYIASFRRLFDADYLHRRATRDKTVPDVPMKDAALAMCVALSGQDPEDFGFSAQAKTTAADSSRYWADNYFFTDDEGKTAEEKRKAAFKKWAEWEKAHPDKIKATPPEKKADPKAPAPDKK